MLKGCHFCKKECGWSSAFLQESGGQSRSRTFLLKSLGFVHFTVIPSLFTDWLMQQMRCWKWEKWAENKYAFIFSHAYKKVDTDMPQVNRKQQYLTYNAIHQLVNVIIGMDYIVVVFWNYILVKFMLNKSSQSREASLKTSRQLQMYQMFSSTRAFRSTASTVNPLLIFQIVLSMPFSL